MLLLFLLTSLAGFSVAATRQPHKVEWGPCKDIALNTTYTYDCGTLTVPFDHASPSNRTVDLQLTRIPAVEQPSRGSVFFNFGGPGLEGRYTLVSLAPTLRA